jgi:hypothetical protein
VKSHSTQLADDNERQAGYALYVEEIVSSNGEATNDGRDSD